MNLLKPASRFRRSGSAYVLVLGTALLVSVIGLSAIAVGRIQIRTSGWANDAREAGVLAFSAVEFALARLDAETIGGDPTWRSTYASGVEQTGPALGNGTMSWMLVDADGNLADDNGDALDLYGIGTVGAARRVYKVSLGPDGTGLDCLQSAVHTGVQLLVYNAADTLNLDGAPATSNGDMQNWGTIDGNVEMVGSYQEFGTTTGTVTTGAAARQMPDPNSVFDYYVTNGTLIDIAALDTCPTGNQCIDRKVLSPTSNPFGSSSSKFGIYVIDCKNQKIEIQNSRIVGTLVILNAAGNSSVQDSIIWEPAIPNYPALMVQFPAGDPAFDFKMSTAALDEFALGANLNPPGTPYMGVEDIDTNDSYPSRIEGLIYINSDVIVYDLALNGVIIVHDELWTHNSIVGTMTVNYASTYVCNPPPGFRVGGKVIPVAGTWTRATLP